MRHVDMKKMEVVKSKVSGQSCSVENVTLLIQVLNKKGSMRREVIFTTVRRELWMKRKEEIKDGRRS